MVYIGEDDNQRVEELTFEVADFESPYNCILGRPFLNKFMAVIHPAYGVMKIPGPKGPIKVQADLHQAVRCDSNALAMTGHFRADENVKVKQVKAAVEQAAGSSKGKALADTGATAPVTPVPPLKNTSNKVGAEEQLKVGDNIPNKSVPLNPEEPNKTVVIGGGLDSK